MIGLHLPWAIAAFRPSMYTLRFVYYHRALIDVEPPVKYRKVPGDGKCPVMHDVRCQEVHAQSRIHV